MKHYEATADTLEFSGHIVYALIAHLQVKDTLPLLERFGLNRVDVNAWYRVNDVLNVVNMVGEGSNATTNLVSIGMEAGNQFVNSLPSEVQSLSLAEILQNEEAMLGAHYRNGDPGYIRVQQIDENHFIHDTYNSWPDDLVYGFVYSVVRHFRPAHTHFNITKDVDIPGQDIGGEFLRLHIRLS